MSLSCVLSITSMPRHVRFASDHATELSSLEPWAIEGLLSRAGRRSNRASFFALSRCHLDLPWEVVAITGETSLDESLKEAVGEVPIYGPSLDAR